MEFTNYVSLIGNITAEPEIREAKNGVPYCAFTLALNENPKDKNDKEAKSITHWISVVLWGDFAVAAEEYIEKGKRIGISGKLTSYKDTVGEKSIERIQVRANKCRVWGEKGSLVIEEGYYLRRNKELNSQQETESEAVSQE